MLGFYPIAGAPLADGQWSDSVALTSQTLSLTENSVLISDDDVIAVAGIPLFLTLNGVTLSTDVDATLGTQTLTLTENSVIVEVQPPAFDSQSLALTLNSVALTTSVNATLASQSMATTLNSIELSTNNYIDLTAETPMGLTLNSVTLSLDVVLPLASQAILLSQRSVSVVTDAVLVAQSQTIYTTLNELRLWKIMDTAQPGTCPDHCDGLWTEIPFDTMVYGDDFAIATQPIGALPQALPPIPKYPGATWANVPTQTTTSWSNIQT